MFLIMQQLINKMFNKETQDFSDWRSRQKVSGTVWTCWWRVCNYCRHVISFKLRLQRGAAGNTIRIGAHNLNKVVNLSGGTVTFPCWLMQLELWPTQTMLFSTSWFAIRLFLSLSSVSFNTRSLPFGERVRWRSSVKQKHCSHVCLQFSGLCALIYANMHFYPLLSSQSEIGIFCTAVIITSKYIKANGNSNKVLKSLKADSSKPWCVVWIYCRDVQFMSASPSGIWHHLRRRAHYCLFRSQVFPPIGSGLDSKWTSPRHRVSSLWVHFNFLLEI